MRVVRVRGGRTPEPKPARSASPTRLRALAWYFRPRIGWSVLGLAAAYVLVQGWPTVLVNYTYSEAYGIRHYNSCTYWNPDAGLIHWPGHDGCPWILGGGHAHQG